MNEIVNKFLEGDKSMPEMRLRHLYVLIVLVDHLLEINNQFRIYANRRFKKYLQK